LALDGDAQWAQKSYWSGSRLHWRQSINNRKWI
jgi:hypothetical protein